MKIETIELKNYRNYDSLEVALGDKLNVIVGKNAQGKTNLLESVFLCAIGRSPRLHKDKDLINWDKDFSKVKVRVNRHIGSADIELYLFRNQNKAIKINGIGIKKIGQLFGNLNAIYFSPDELKLIKESPDERRKFMDIDLCQFDKNYFYDLANYNKVLQQRNKLLKNSNESALKETISIWNEQLAISGAKIILARCALIEKLKVHAGKIHAYLTSDKEELKLSYQGIVGDNVAELQSLLLKKYSETLDKDIHLGYTTVGPHRDDIKIESNGIDLRTFGSQGQQRTGALSLKLAELEVFKDNIGEYPVLLLDDVLSELDETRQSKLLEFVSSVQTLITCTDYNINIPHKKFVIEGGNIKSIEDI
ncbi:MAG: DNA replication/repair protein RecF [Clostridiales bacterium]|nr:DNA replication/repair protein RecF [Clostridiales bacterium]